jgi:hypothetical protein
MLTFKQYLNEVVKLRLGKKSGGGNIDGFLDDYHDSTKPHPFDSHTRLHGMVGVELSRASDHVHVHDIRNYGEAKKGHGTHTLKHLTSLADKHGVELRGIAKAYSKSKDHVRSTAKLKGWYQKHGFGVERGNKDDGYDISYKGKKS